MSSQKFSPSGLRNFFGQQQIKKRLQVLFEKRGRFPASIFIYGPVGSGKTALVKLIAKKLSKEIIYVDGITESADLISRILSSVLPAIFVIEDLDQTHSPIQKLIGRMIKNNSLKIFYGQEKKPLKIKLSDLLIIGLSSRAGQVPKFIRENFNEVWHLERYKIREIKKIIVAVSKKLKFDLDNDAAWEIAHAGRKNPGWTINLLGKIIDFAETKNRKKIDLSLVQSAFSAIGIDRIGLEKFDRDLLKIIIEKFSGGPVGIENYAAKLGESPWNIEEIHEPYLIEIGFLKRTPRGRIATREAHKYLGYQYAVGKAPAKLEGPRIARSQKKLL